MRSRRVNRTEKIELRVRPEFKQQVYEAAEAEGESVSRWLERLIQKELRKGPVRKSAGEE